MQKLEELLFSPLSKKWCSFYYFLMLFSYVGFVIVFFTSIYSLFLIKKFKFSQFLLLTVFPILNSFVMYLISRLGYSICLGALK